MPDPHFANTPAYFKEVSTGDTPSSGQVALYAKTDGLFYSKDDAGIEVSLGGLTTGVLDIDTVVTKTASFTITLEDSGKIFECFTSPSEPPTPITVTLPSITGMPIGWHVWVEKSQTITNDRQVIVGGLITVRYPGRILVYYDGTALRAESYTRSTGTTTHINSNPYLQINLGAGAAGIFAETAFGDLSFGSYTRRVGFDWGSAFAPHTNINTYPLGTSVRRWGNLFTAGYANFGQITTPALPATNSAQIYSKDVGGTAMMYVMDENGTETLIGGGNDVKWNSAYSTVQTNSGNWNYQGTDIKSLTGNWQDTYTSFSSQSANNLSVFSTVQTSSASWGGGGGSQTLSFNESNADLTISSGNTVSLSALSGSSGNSSVIYTYLTNSTWTNPSPTIARPVTITLIGGGGGGGSGRSDNTGTTCGGGGAGAGAGLVMFNTYTNLLSAFEDIIVGAGGAGGARTIGQGANGGNGNPTTMTLSGITLRAIGGALGNNGTTAAAGGGGPVTNSTVCFNNVAINIGGGGGSSGAANASSPAAATYFVPTGGGGGGGVNAANTLFTAAAGGGFFAITTLNLINGAAVGVGAGASGSNGYSYLGVGAGGAGGNASNVSGTLGGNGGAGGFPGGGGGGGGGYGVSGGAATQSGAGGAGGNGVATIIVY
jgi:hypothetical protein